ncbi:MAG: hypothetical protein R3E46_18470 [Sedimenticolaceae bacterium]|nr:hypothetical protein [Gammaproteobacteria bacterium]
MTRRLLVICGLLAVLLSQGCGTKGPLTLPQGADAAHDQAKTNTGKTE